jgi:hypothetical protein
VFKKKEKIKEITKEQATKFKRKEKSRASSAKPVEEEFT